MTLRESYRSEDTNYGSAMSARHVNIYSDPQLQRRFVYLLLFICLLALIPRLILGATQLIQYDGYWHIFIATQNRWRLFVSEWKGDAHPPLYYLLLRWCAKLGSYPLIYRMLSIVPGTVSVYVLGQVAAKFYRSSNMALLAAAAYGFSLTIIEMDFDVRAYPLSLLFVLCACYCLLELLIGPEQRTASTVILFGASCSLAILTEYMTIFFFLASLVVLPVLGVRFPEIRRRLLDLLHAKPRMCIIVLIFPFVVIAWLYQVHVRYQPPTQGNVEAFYWAKGTSMLDFVLRNLRNEVNFLLPLEITSIPVCAILTVVVLAAMLYMSFVHRGDGKQVAAAAIGLLLSGILAELIFISLARRYPFGGFARQQSILFPFLVLTVFWLLDSFSAKLPRAAQLTVQLAVALLITASFLHGWSKFPKLKEDLFTAEFNKFCESLPRSKALYIDQFSLIGYYIHTHDWKWNFQRHYREPERIDEYRTTSPRAEQRVVVRNLDQWNFDLFRPETYGTLARLLRDSHIPSADIFYVRQFPHDMNAAEISADKQRFQDLAKTAGLSIGTLYYDGKQAYIHASRQ